MATEITAKLSATPRQAFKSEQDAENAIASFLGTLAPLDARELEGTLRSNEEEFDPPYYVSIGRFMATPTEVLGWL